MTRTLRKLSFPRNLILSHLSQLIIIKTLRYFILSIVGRTADDMTSNDLVSVKLTFLSSSTFL
uniref:Uncharacterized protein n=1 Tax=Arundo donax TaxID=35708 RepID=A0A0A9G796_ARUDO